MKGDRSNGNYEVSKAMEGVHGRGLLLVEVSYCSSTPTPFTCIEANFLSLLVGLACMVCPSFLFMKVIFSEDHQCRNRIRHQGSVVAYE